MSTRLKFSKGGLILFTLFHAVASIYFCGVASISLLRSHLAWCWNPLANYFWVSGESYFATPAIVGLPVSALVGVCFGYLVPFICKVRVKSRAMRIAIVNAAFIVMLLVGPALLHLLFPFVHGGDLGILIFGPIFLCVVWGVFTGILAIFVIDVPDLHARFWLSTLCALALTIAWLAVGWIYSAATSNPSLNPHHGP